MKLTERHLHIVAVALKDQIKKLKKHAKIENQLFGRGNAMDELLEFTEGFAKEVKEELSKPENVAKFETRMKRVKSVKAS